MKTEKENDSLMEDRTKALENLPPLKTNENIVDGEIIDDNDSTTISPLELARRNINTSAIDENGDSVILSAELFDELVNDVNSMAAAHVIYYQTLHRIITNRSYLFVASTPAKMLEMMGKKETAARYDVGVARAFGASPHLKELMTHKPYLLFQAKDDAEFVADMNDDDAENISEKVQKKITSLKNKVKKLTSTIESQKISNERKDADLRALKSEVEDLTDVNRELSKQKGLDYDRLKLISSTEDFILHLNQVERCLRDGFAVILETNEAVTSDPGVRHELKSFHSSLEHWLSVLEENFQG